MPRLGRDPRQPEHARQERCRELGGSRVLARVANLPEVRGERPGIQIEVGRARPALHADVDGDRPAPYVPADDLLQLGLEHGVGIGPANGHFQVAVVHRADFDPRGQPVDLSSGLAEPGHAEQHAGGPRGGLSGTGRTRAVAGRFAGGTH